MQVCLERDTLYFLPKREEEDYYDDEYDYGDEEEYEDEG